MSLARPRLFALAGPLLLALTTLAVAQEPTGNAEKPAGDKSGEEKSADPPPAREQTIYVPYSKLRETFEKEGRGVFIPYERFQELWKAAREQQRKQPEAQPPLPAVITEADSEATVGKDVVRVSARLKIDLLAQGWVEVPLRLDDAGVIAAAVVDADGKEEPARLAVVAEHGYKLVVENKTKAVRHIELRLEYAKPFNKMPGRNDVSFAAPQAPVNRWKVRIPESGVKININPLIAATQPPQADDKKDKGAEKAAEESVLLAFVGAAPNVRIDWTAKAEGASGLAALASVEAQQEVRVEEGAVRTRARLTYAISRAELVQLTVEVPADQKVVNVSETNVRQWSVKTDGKTQTITVQLFEPARRSESILVELEQFSDQADDAKAEPEKPQDEKAAEPARRSVDVPLVRALDVSRQQGIVVIDVAAGLQAEARTREGLSQLDAADLPTALAGQAHDLSYRYAALPFTLTLDVVKVKPRILVDELVLAHLEPEQLTLQLQALYTIERAGVFELAIDVPAGYQIREVSGRALSKSEPVQVDSHHLEGEGKTRLVVNLSHKAMGRSGLVVELRKRLEDANLLGPTGKSSDVPLSVPRVAPDSVERTNGRLVIYAPESLRVNPGHQSGLLSVSLAEALPEGSAPGVNYPQTAKQAPTERPVSAFVFSKEPIELTLEVERRKPQITVGQLLVARVDPGVVKYEATFFYEVRYSGVRSLRIDLPAELAADLRNNTPGITEKVLTPAPDDLPKDYIAWSLTGESELSGSVTIRLSWERRLENLDVGKSVDLSVPRLLPRDVDRAWGQIVLVKAETIELSPAGTPAGLRPIDPQHDLMSGASVADAALAFEFQDEWSLTVAAARYQLESVKHTSIDRSVVRAVVTRGGQLAVQALYRMRSARQRLAVGLPAGVEFDTEPLRINGQPTPLERGAKDEFYVPLVGRGNNEPFLLELRYTLAKSGTRVDLPAFVGEPAVQKVMVAVFLPQELDLLGYSGPWTDEQAWVTRSLWRRVPAPRYTDSGLVNWVREGVSISGNPADTFPVDGQFYVFSTLRPENGASGSLQFTTLNHKWLQFLIFAGVVGIGLALVSRPLAERSAALTALVIALLLVGVFLPTFSQQIMYGGLWLAILLTGLVWIGWFLLHRQRASTTAAPVAATSVDSASPPVQPPDGGPPQGGEHHA